MMPAELRAVLSEPSWPGKSAKRVCAVTSRPPTFCLLVASGNVDARDKRGHDGEL